MSDQTIAIEAPEAARLADWDVPSLWGIVLDDIGSRLKTTWGNQCRFLDHYSETRLKGLSARGAGVSRQGVLNWEGDNLLRFKDRLALADEYFCDSLEKIAWDRIREQNATANPLLLLALLNANRPDKYRPTVVISDDTAKETLRELRRLGKQQKVQAGKQRVDDKKAVDDVDRFLKLERRG